MKDRAAAKLKNGSAINKWIEIYSERVGKLERQVSKLGLKTQLHSSTTKSAASA